VSRVLGDSEGCRFLLRRSFGSVELVEGMDGAAAIGPLVVWVSDSEVVDSRIGVVDFGEVCVTGGTLQSAGPVGVCAVMADSFELDLRGLGGVYLSG